MRDPLSCELPTTKEKEMTVAITAKSTLKTLESLINKLSDTDGNQCTELCMVIDTILDKLDTWAVSSIEAKDKHPCCDSAGIYITEMKSTLYSIAGLNDFRFDKTTCISRLRNGIEKLASVHCFSVDI